MPCYYPLRGWRSRKKSETGKYGIVFALEKGLADMPMQVPCGQCIGCRLERSRQWAIRIMNEATSYSTNSFITLTYSPENLPEHGTLVKAHFQKFIKRLRKRFPQRIRYFHCGEYGAKLGRPHYHAILFNVDFKDKTFWRFNESKDEVYRSETLEKLWPYGFSTIGEVTFESAAYVARYVTKKITGDKAPAHYETEVIDEETGEILLMQEEYCTMSRRPGIGYEWYQKFKSDFYPKDYIHLNGAKMRPPKYYDNLYELEEPQVMQELKNKRQSERKKHEKDQTDERLEAMEKVKTKQFKMLKRGAEDG